MIPESQYKSIIEEVQKCYELNTPCILVKLEKSQEKEGITKENLQIFSAANSSFEAIGILQNADFR